MPVPLQPWYMPPARKGTLFPLCFLMAQAWNNFWNTSKDLGLLYNLIAPSTRLFTEEIKCALAPKTFFTTALQVVFVVAQLWGGAVEMIVYCCQIWHDEFKCILLQYRKDAMFSHDGGGVSYTIDPMCIFQLTRMCIIIFGFCRFSKIFCPLGISKVQQSWSEKRLLVSTMICMRRKYVYKM